jgi:hypothetical protein
MIFRTEIREKSTHQPLQSWAEKATFATNELGFSVLMGRAVATHFETLIADIELVYFQIFPEKVGEKNLDQVYSIIKVYRKFLEDIALPSSNFDSQNGWQLFLYALKGPELALQQNAGQTNADQATSDQEYRNFSNIVQKLFGFRLQKGRDFFSGGTNITEKILMTFFQEQMHNFPADAQTIKEIPTLPYERETKFDQQNPTIEAILDRYSELLTQVGANVSAETYQERVQQLSQWCESQLETAQQFGMDIHAASVFLEPKSETSSNTGFKLRIPTVYITALEQYSKAGYIWKDFNSADITELLSLGLDARDQQESQLRTAYLARAAALLLAIINIEQVFLKDWDRQIIVKGDGSILEKSTELY